MTDKIQNSSDIVSLKDIFLRGQFFFRGLKKHIWKIFICGLLSGIIGFVFAWMQPIVYSAKTTFIVEDGKSGSSGLGGLASLAGQFGVDVGGASGGGVFSNDNILLYFKSISLAREVLLSHFDSTSNQSLADYYADVYDLKRGWEKNSKVGKINFPILNSRKTYSRLQDSLLLKIIDVIIEKQFKVVKSDKKAGFIDVTTSMENELLAKVYCERIVQRAVFNYINLKTQRQKATVNKLQERVDSIAKLLLQKTVSGANLQNYSTTVDINPLYKAGTSVAVETTLRDKAMLSSIFASVTQNLEMAKFTLSQETPVIQIIDSPIFPLKMEKKSRLKTSIIFSFVSCFIFIFYLIGKNFFKSMLN